MTRWFGQSWGAPVCIPNEHVETPVGSLCLGWCKEPIEEGDRGVVLPSAGADGPTEIAYHLECWLRSVLGSVGHIEGRCWCVLGEDGEEDPPGLTKREAAVAALAAYERRHGGRVT